MGVPPLPEPPGRLLESANVPVVGGAVGDVMLPILLLLLLPRRTDIPDAANPTNDRQNIYKVRHRLVYKGYDR